MAEPSDPDLIARARAGDKAAFEDLLRPVVAAAARLAYAMLQNRTEAEDVVQEAAFKAWRRLGNVRAGANFKPWFLGIVANQCRTARRAPSWGALHTDHAPAAGQPGLEEAAVRRSDIRSSLFALPIDQRAAIVLHFYLDLPLDVVAEVLDISVAGVKSRINRGLKRMRPALQSYEAFV